MASVGGDEERMECEGDGVQQQKPPVSDDDTDFLEKHFDGDFNGWQYPNREILRPTKLSERKSSLSGLVLNDLSFQYYLHGGNTTFSVAGRPRNLSPFSSVYKYGAFRSGRKQRVLKRDIRGEFKFPPDWEEEDWGILSNDDDPTTKDIKAPKIPRKQNV